MEGGKKSPGTRPGPASLIAVAARHLLREEKQGTTALRLSSVKDFTRAHRRGPPADLHAPPSARRPTGAPVSVTPPPFPAARPRRLRKDAFTRALVREHRLAPEDLILPVFLLDGERREQDVASMPGVKRAASTACSRWPSAVSNSACR
jgi:hypothetical protein